MSQSLLKLRGVIPRISAPCGPWPRKHRHVSVAWSPAGPFPFQEDTPGTSPRWEAGPCFRAAGGASPAGELYCRCEIKSRCLACVWRTGQAGLEPCWGPEISQARRRRWPAAVGESRAPELTLALLQGRAGLGGTLSAPPAPIPGGTFSACQTEVTPAECGERAPRFCGLCKETAGGEQLTRIRRGWWRVPFAAGIPGGREILCKSPPAGAAWGAAWSLPPGQSRGEEELENGSRYSSVTSVSE
ncbi:unnamed protein product [Natator depressus]